MLRIAVFPADRGGCGHYRLIWPALAVRSTCCDVDVKLADELDPIHVGYKEDTSADEPLEYNTPITVSNVPDVDVMVFQRPLHAKWQHLFPLLKQHGIRIVVDIDDHFDRIDPRNVAWHAVEPNWLHKDEAARVREAYGPFRVDRVSANGNWVHTLDHQGATNRVHLNQALKHADLITVSSAELRSYYARFAPTVLLRNAVPVDHLRPRAHTGRHSVVTVGWTGSVLTHPEDLEEIGTGLRQACARTRAGFKFKVVGTGRGVTHALGVAPDETTGWVDLADYPAAYGTLDVALCPLKNTPFNRAKSWLKPLEAAAVGAVPIMSPLPEYERLHELGVGVIARRPRDWARHIVRLVDDDDYRTRLREQGFKVAAANTCETRASEWAEAWRQAWEQPAESLF